MQRQQAIVFDLDGTLVDSADDIVAALNLGMQLAARPVVEKEAAYGIISVGLERMVELALESSGGLPDADVLASIQQACLEYDDSHLLVHTQPYPGAVRALEGLRARDVRLGVCTNKRFAPARRVLEGLGLSHCFGVVIGRDSGLHRKPHPGPLLDALHRLAVDPAHAVLVGDSEIDVACARAAGVPVVVMRHGYSGAPADDLGADCVVDDFAALGAALDAIGRRAA